MTTAGVLRSAAGVLDDRTNALLRSRWVFDDDGMLAELIDLVVPPAGEAASVAAAEWYGAERAAQGVGGMYVPEPAPVRPVGGYALVGWASNLGTGPVQIQELILGGVSKRIQNAVRDTIMLNSQADPMSNGWQRSASGGCTFCQMLASRGAVYSATTVQFSSHDNCRCVAVPAFKGKPLPVKKWDSVGSKRQKIEKQVWRGKNGEVDWEKTERRRASALNTLKNDQKRARQWMKDNPVG